MKEKHYNFRFDANLAQELESIAVATNRSRAEVIRILIQEAAKVYLHADQQQAGEKNEHQK